jgi:hypothetical protein
MHTLPAMCSSSEVGSGECAGACLLLTFIFLLVLREDSILPLYWRLRIRIKGVRLFVSVQQSCLFEAYVGVYFRFGCL